MKADGLEGTARGGTDEAVVPHSGEAFGQDVDEPTADELVRMQGEDAGFTGITVCPVEADVALFIVADDASRPNGTTLDVAGKVADGGGAASDVLELDVPCFVGEECGSGLVR